MGSMLIRWAALIGALLLLAIAGACVGGAAFFVFYTSLFFGLFSLSESGSYVGAAMFLLALAGLVGSVVLSNRLVLPFLKRAWQKTQRPY